MLVTVDPLDVQFRHTKAPGDYRLQAAPYQFVQMVEDELSGASLLAPIEMITTVPLIVPDIRIEAHRPYQTTFAFLRLDQLEEGQRRVAAQKAVSCVINDETLAAFYVSAQNVDTIIMDVCDSDMAVDQQELIAWLEAQGWSIYRENPNYIMLVQ